MLSNKNDQLEPECSGKVLFVDDEKNILKSIERGFFCADFELFTALGAREGLQRLEEDDIDIVISDFRMAEINGLEFLKIVKEKYPKVSRVILSGYVEESTIVNSFTSGITILYLTKPWDSEILEERINHILQIREKLNSRKLLEVINCIDQLPTLPVLYQEFVKAMEAEQSIKEISKIVEKDMSVSTKILQVANSAFYGLKGESSLEHSMSYIGLTQVKNIVLTVSLVKNMQWTAEQTTQLQNIFFHSSLVNRHIPPVYNMRSDVKKVKQFPAIGLTHDIGKVILLQYFPKQYQTINEHQKQYPEKTFYESELELGLQKVAHTHIGAYFLDWWNLPDVLAEFALFHHTPEYALGNYKELMEATTFIDTVANILWNMKNENIDFDLSKFECDFLSEKNIESIVLAIKEDIDNGNNY